MPIRIVLVDHDKIVALPDPAGGTFDAAGDFDRLLPMETRLPVAASPTLAMLSRIEAYADVEFSSDEMADVIQDVAMLLELARPGPETRGLERLRVMAALCAQIPNAVLRVAGD